jgi:hypothetical protein
LLATVVRLATDAGLAVATRVVRLTDRFVVVVRWAEVSLAEDGLLAVAGAGSSGV